MTFHRARTNKHGFDMTPMIDVVFQLMIFFMYTAQFAQITRTPIDLPDEPGEEQAAQVAAEIVIDVQEDGTYLAEREVVGLDRLTQMVQIEVDREGSPADVSILIRAHRDAEMRHVNRLATRLAEMGIRRVNMGTINQIGSGP
jgi:biopolymer transport protein ExbD